MRRVIAIGLTVLAAQLAASSPRAATGTIQFGGLIDGICTIVVGVSGALDISADGLTISTDYGYPATAVVTTTGTGFDLSVGTPSVFDTAPTDGNTGVTFQTSYTTTGITTVSGILGGVATALGIGITNVSVDLSASRSDVFPSGTYGAETTITCE
mgnify:CR=1 FL=1